MRMRRLLLMMPVVCALQAAHAATVTGDLRDITGQPLSIRITFRPELTPLFDGTQTVLDIPRSVWSTNGTFTADLVGGWYTAEFGPYGKPIRIAVPQNPGTYTFAYCASLRTNVTTYYLPLTSLAAGWGILAQTNQTLVTVSIDPNVLTAGGQTPWAQDIDAAGHSLLNLGNLDVRGTLYGDAAGLTNLTARDRLMVINRSDWPVLTNAADEDVLTFPSVVWDPVNGKWHLYVSRSTTTDQNQHIALFVSTDAKTWDRHGNVVLPGGSGDFANEIFCGVPVVWLESNGTWWMAYLSRLSPGTPSWAIAFASSTDGTNWTKQQRLNLPGHWSYGNTEPVNVLRVGGTNFLYHTTVSPDSNGRRIGILWSADNVTWYAHPEPVISTPTRYGHGVFNGVVLPMRGSYWAILPFYSVGTEEAGLGLWNADNPWLTNAVFHGTVMGTRANNWDNRNLDVIGVFTDDHTRTTWNAIGGRMLFYYGAQGRSWTWNGVYEPWVMGSAEFAWGTGDPGVVEDSGFLWADFLNVNNTNVNLEYRLDVAGQAQVRSNLVVGENLVVGLRSNVFKKTYTAPAYSTNWIRIAETVDSVARLYDGEFRLWWGTSGNHGLYTVVVNGMWQNLSRSPVVQVFGSAYNSPQIVSAVRLVYPPSSSSGKAYIDVLVENNTSSSQAIRIAFTDTSAYGISLLDPVVVTNPIAPYTGAKVVVSSLEKTSWRVSNAYGDVSIGSTSGELVSSNGAVLAGVTRMNSLLWPSFSGARVSGNDPVDTTIASDLGGNWLFGTLPYTVEAPNNKLFRADRRYSWVYATNSSGQISASSLAALFDGVVDNTLSVPVTSLPLHVEVTNTAAIATVSQYFGFILPGHRGTWTTSTLKSWVFQILTSSGWVTIVDRQNVTDLQPLGFAARPTSLTSTAIYGFRLVVLSGDGPPWSTTTLTIPEIVGVERGKTAMARSGELLAADGGDLYGSLTVWSNLVVGTGAGSGASIIGNGAGITNIQPSGIAQSGATAGQVLKWTGTQWAPGYDLQGSGGGGVSEFVAAGQNIAVATNVTANGTLYTVSLPDELSVSSLTADDFIQTSGDVIASGQLTAQSGSFSGNLSAQGTVSAPRVQATDYVSALNSLRVGTATRLSEGFLDFGNSDSDSFINVGTERLYITNALSIRVDGQIEMPSAVVTNSLEVKGVIHGNGIGVTNIPLSGLAQSGAALGQVPQWDGTQWVPASVNPVNLGFFDVKSYGAQGDGVTDDTYAIQSAIEAARAAGGGIVWFPPGTYMVSTNDAGWVNGNGTPASLIITNVGRIELRGAGRNLSIIKVVPTLTTTLAPQGVIMLEHINVSEVIVSDLTFDGNREARGITTTWTAYNEDDGYSVEGSDRLVATRVRVQNVANDAFDIDNVKNSVFVDCEALNSGETGFGFGGNCTNIVASSLRVYNCGWLVGSPNADNGGFVLHDVFNAQINGLLLASNYVALDVAGAKNIVIDGVTVVPKPGVVTTNIMLAGGLSGVRLSDVVVRYEPGFGPVANTVGIWLGRRYFGATQLYSPTTDVWIDGGFVHAYYPVLGFEAYDIRISGLHVNGYEGVFLRSVTNVVVEGNYIQASPSMRVQGESRDITVRNNTFSVYAYGPEFVGPGPFLISGNHFRRQASSSNPSLRLWQATTNAVVTGNVISSNLGPFWLAGSNHVVSANAFYSGLALYGTEVQGNEIRDNVIGGGGVTVASGTPSYGAQRWINNKRPDGGPVDLAVALTRTDDSYLPASVPLSALSQSGAAAGQVPQWNGSSWVPATVSGGGGGGQTVALTNAYSDAGSLKMDLQSLGLPARLPRTYVVTIALQGETSIEEPGLSPRVSGDRMVWLLQKLNSASIVLGANSFHYYTAVMRHLTNDINALPVGAREVYELVWDSGGWRLANEANTVVQPTTNAQPAEPFYGIASIGVDQSGNRASAWLPFFWQSPVGWGSHQIWRVQNTGNTLSSDYTTLNLSGGNGTPVKTNTLGDYYAWSICIWTNGSAPSVGYMHSHNIKNHTKGTYAVVWNVGLNHTNNVRIALAVTGSSPLSDVPQNGGTLTSSRLGFVLDEGIWKVWMHDGAPGNQTASYVNLGIPASTNYGGEYSLALTFKDNPTGATGVDWWINGIKVYSVDDISVYMPQNWDDAGATPTVTYTATAAGVTAGMRVYSLQAYERPRRFEALW